MRRQCINEARTISVPCLHIFSVQQRLPSRCQIGRPDKSFGPP